MEKKMKRCPYCGEMIMATAKKCRYCGSWLDGSHGYDSTNNQNAEEPAGNEPTENMEQAVAEPAPSVAANYNNEEEVAGEDQSVDGDSEVEDDSEVEYDDNGDPIEEKSTKQQVMELIGVLLYIAGFICFCVWKFSDAGNALFITAMVFAGVGVLLRHN